MYEFYEDSKRIYLIAEYCKGGELFDMILKRLYFTEQEAANIMSQLLSSIGYCHSLNIVHRDIKPENLLISSKIDLNIKVIDFGTAMIFDPKQMITKKSGTPYYIAPEVLQKSYTSKCDIWSAGVIMYILLCGNPPFNGKNDEDILRSVAKGKYNFAGDNWSNISKEAKDLIAKMLTYDPNERISALEAFHHPWIIAFKDNKIFKSPTALHSLSHLKKFKAGEKIKQAAMTYIASQLVGDKDKKELKSLFQAMDSNGDGMLSKEEMLDGCKKVFGESFTKEQVEEIFSKVDTDKSGFIDYNEFILASMSEETLMSTEYLKEAFEYMDKDGSGEISMEEIKAILWQKNISDEAWMKLIKEVDKNGDGVISFDEFVQVMKKIC